MVSPLTFLPPQPPEAEAEVEPVPACAPALSSGVFDYLAPACCITVRRLGPEDTEALQAFEQRYHAECALWKVQPSSALQYQNLQSRFHHAMQMVQIDAEQGYAYGYLVHCGQQLIGTFRVTHIRHFMSSAELVWRVTPSYATQETVRRTIQEALNCAFYVHGLQRVQSRTLMQDDVAIRALTDNGFYLRTQVGLRLPTRVYEIVAPPCYEALLHTHHDAPTVCSVARRSQNTNARAHYVQGA